MSYLININRTASTFRKAADWLERNPAAWGQNLFCKDVTGSAVDIRHANSISIDEMVQTGCTFCGLGAVLAFDDTYELRKLDFRATQLVTWVNAQLLELSQSSNIWHGVFYNFNDAPGTTVEDVVEMLRFLGNRAEQHVA